MRLCRDAELPEGQRVLKVIRTIHACLPAPKMRAGSLDTII